MLMPNKLKYRCNICDQGFAEKHQLEAHLIKHGGDKVMCSVCDKNFTTTFLLRHHIAGAHENVKHQCRAAAVRSGAVVLLLLTFCLLLLPLWESVIVLCFVVRYFMSILVLQSS